MLPLILKPVLYDANCEVQSFLTLSQSKENTYNQLCQGHNSWVFNRINMFISVFDSFNFLRGNVYCEHSTANDSY